MRFPIALLCLLISSAASAADTQPAPGDGAASAPQAAGTGVLADPRLPPLVDQARQSYPEARKKFAAGLPRGDKFLVRVELKDAAGAGEIAVLRVRTIIDGVIKGQVYVPPKSLAGFAFGQPSDVKEGEILDWIIAKGDGTEEGDFMGHLLGKVP
jgi:hypothetical protein